MMGAMKPDAMRVELRQSLAMSDVELNAWFD
jgi:hypothetical protein